MKTKSILILLLMVLSLSACTPKPTQDKNESLADSLITGYSNAISSGDLEKTMSYVADDVLVLDMGATFAGKDTLRTHMQPLMPFYKNFTFHKGLIAVNDDLITYHGLFSVDWAMETTPQPVRGVATLIWQKQPDGSWKMILEKIDFGMLVKK
jgi:ketosteroid isomerase-like protein